MQQLVKQLMSGANKAQKSTYSDPVESVEIIYKMFIHHVGRKIKNS